MAPEAISRAYQGAPVAREPHIGVPPEILHSQLAYWFELFTLFSLILHPAYSYKEQKTDITTFSWFLPLCFVSFQPPFSELVAA